MSSTQKYCDECRPVVRTEKRRADSARWAKTNPEKIRAKSAKYREGNAEKVKAGAAKWDRENPEKVKASSKADCAKYRKANLEKCGANVAKWQKANPEKVKASSKASNAKWCKGNPEKCAIKDSKRRALKYANTPLDEMLTSTEWLAILAEANGRCAYCDKEAKLTLDHVIPLSKGGKHSADNVVPACAHCNKSKGNKTVEEWNNVTRQQLEAARG
jgi:5-methylcytosine-specific restriction endonuclease McrA